MNTDELLTDEVSIWRSKHKVNLVPKDATKSPEKVARWISVRVVLNMGLRSRDNLKQLVAHVVRELQAETEPKHDFRISHLYWKGVRTEPLNSDGIEILTVLVADCLYVIGRNLVTNTLPKNEQVKARQKEKEEREWRKIEAGI